MTERGSLDTVFSDLIKEAEHWAQQSTPVDPRQDSDNQRETTQESDESRNACLDQIARAITAHVTDVLIKRLGIEENDEADVIQKKLSRLSLPASTTSSRGNSPNTTRRSRTSNPSSYTRRYAGNNPDNIYPQEPWRGLGKQARFHSENRLDRTLPAPAPKETPLENRASRLRKISLERKHMPGTETPRMLRSRRNSATSNQ